MIYKHVHFVGIGGISLSALAIMLSARGVAVSGSDATASPITDKLKQLSINVSIGHSAQNVYGSDLVVISSAIHEDNPEVVEAKKQGIPIITRAQLLGEIASEYKNVISIAGTHGKTTTTGMVATIFIGAGLNPTVHIGGELPIINGNVRLGAEEYFITEACEYKDSFLSLKSQTSAITNIQKDHMDYFKKMSNLQNSFKNFAKNTNKSGFVVIDADDKNCKKICANVHTISFGINVPAVVEAHNIVADSNQKYSYNLFYYGKNLGKIELSVPGYHNVSNSLCAVAVAFGYGINFATIAKGLKEYKPSLRRFEKIKNPFGYTVIHDYAHHPTELLATITTAKKLCKSKLIAVFQPHTYSRTQSLWKEFVAAFRQVDYVILPPIYPAREAPIKGITSEKLSLAIKKSGVNSDYANSLEEAYKKIKIIAHKNDIVLLLGAGTIQKMCGMFSANK